MTREVHVIDSIAEFMAIAPAWDSCLLRMPAPSLFLSSSWLHAWWLAWGQDMSMEILIILDGKQVLAGAPLCSRHTKYYGLPVRELKFIGEPAADRQEFICTPQSTDALTVLWSHLRDHSRDFDLVRLEELPQSSDTLAAARDAGIALEGEPSSVLPYLRILGKWEDFEKGLADRFRSEMHTRPKVFNSWGKWAFEIVDGPAAADYFAAIVRLELESTKGTKGYALFSDPRNAEMIRSLLRSASGNLIPLLSVLRLEDKMIGYLLGFKFQNKYHAYNTAFLSEYGKGSPGKWIIHKTIRYAFDEALEEFDFLRGASYVKSRWYPEERCNLRAVMFGQSVSAWLLRPAVFRIRPWLKQFRWRGGK